MLTLSRMNRRYIYSLSANGGERSGYMGLGPETGHNQVPDVRWGPVVRCLMGARTSGGRRISMDGFKGLHEERSNPGKIRRNLWMEIGEK